MARIVLPKGKLEAHFVFFYDLKVKIADPLQHRIRDAATSDWFVLRDVRRSELSLHYFSDEFISRWVVCHFHGAKDALYGEHLEADEQVGIVKLQYRVNGQDRIAEFVLPDSPPGVTTDPPRSYSFLEGTLFDNGILVITIRLRNNDDIDDSQYVDLIARPEYTDRVVQSSSQSAGRLVAEVDRRVFEYLEPKLAAFLNKLELSCVHIDGGVPRRLHVMPQHSRERRITFLSEDYLPTGGPLVWKGQTVDPESPDAERTAWPGNDTRVLHRLQRSRPYIGTVVDLMEGDPPRIPERFLTTQSDPPDDWRTVRCVDGQGRPRVVEDRVVRFALAAARTTPKFIDSFVNLRTYWTESPRRDIYDPGPSIVFIGRRGWVCVKLEDRDGVSFHLGVVETVLFTLQAILASVRALRRFVEQVKFRGDRAVRELGIHAADPTEATHSARIAEFTSFIARARFVSPTDDLSILQSYVSTHTGLAALRRIRSLTEYEAQVANARRTLARYEASLQAVYERRQAEQVAAQLRQLETLSTAGVQNRTVIALTVAVIVISVLSWFIPRLLECRSWPC